MIYIGKDPQQILWDMVKDLRTQIPIYKETMHEEAKDTPNSYILLRSEITDTDELKGDGKTLTRYADCDIILVSKGFADDTTDLHNVNKKLIKELKYDLLTALMVKYADLSEEDIKRLVIEKKWFASLGSRLDGEMQRISQQLTSKVSALAERYAQTLQEIDAEIAELEAKVAGHLKLMGY